MSVMTMIFYNLRKFVDEIDKIEIGHNRHIIITPTSKFSLEEEQQEEARKEK